MPTYEILVKCSIELAGRFDAPSQALAIDAAKRELRVSGHMADDIEVERAILVDDQADAIDYGTEPPLFLPTDQAGDPA